MIKMESRIQNTKKEIQKFIEMAQNYLEIIKRAEERTPKRGIMDLQI